MRSKSEIVFSLDTLTDLFKQGMMDANSTPLYRLDHTVMYT